MYVRVYVSTCACEVACLGIPIGNDEENIFDGDALQFNSVGKMRRKHCCSRQEMIQVWVTL